MIHCENNGILALYGFLFLSKAHRKMNNAADICFQYTNPTSGWDWFDKLGEKITCTEMRNMFFYDYNIILTAATETDFLKITFISKNTHGT